MKSGGGCFSPSVNKVSPVILYEAPNHGFVGGHLSYEQNGWVEDIQNLFVGMVNQQQQVGRFYL